ncbi:dihydrodipicolinate synthase family protein [Evansella cellulosilytica]|uniref:Dihydrodipicolinate synthetase n=1 Tax=Evansella cellulosilytica (strain ATCC 21833 / DSM 2522 / FERM P-1141 / JCM 9156 / N-4) TaxID=649639 RepID=E6TT72_EVAC2|nr:dihydrodipicolinate synthase family protein [Evansella cellulosilytica]ADU31980.1 dihydrodipicolinate synthetase [Evansella cellulosilytica DSM 2522]
MFKGIYTPLVTLFNENGEIDYEANKMLINDLIEQDIDGIVLLGTIGEFMHLTLSEKIAYTKEIKDFVGTRTKVIVGTGDNNVADVVKFNQVADSIGIDACMVISPFFLGQTEESLLNYYSTILDQSSIPIILYNFPERTSSNLSIELVKKLAIKYNHLVGIKDTVSNFSNTRKYIQEIKTVRKDFSVLSGLDEFLIPNLLSGGDGIIGGTTNFNPSLYLQTYRAFQEKDFNKLFENQQKINQIVKIYDCIDSFIVAMKTAVKITYSHDISVDLRYSKNTLTDENIKDIKKIISVS